MMLTRRLYPIMTCDPTTSLNSGPPAPVLALIEGLSLPVSFLCRLPTSAPICGQHCSFHIRHWMNVTMWKSHGFHLRAVLSLFKAVWFAPLGPMLAPAPSP